ncbi:MAG: hypothetical protein Q8J69_11505 [Sphingobacteriaceae bacterium]|nr:hypothetical protein [Sphingobacteriaceae bacterium]
MSLGGSIQGMIASIRQNTAMLRSANRKTLNGDILMRGSGKGKRGTQGGKFKSVVAREAFMATVAEDRRKSNQKLLLFSILALLLLLGLIGWMIR